MQPDLRRLSKDYAHRRARFTLSFYPPNFSPNNCVLERPTQSETGSPPLLKTSMSCKSGTYSDTMTTGSDNFVLAYNQQVGGTSPLAPTRSKGIPSTRLHKIPTENPTRISKLADLFVGDGHVVIQHDACKLRVYSGKRGQ